MGEAVNTFKRAGFVLLLKLAQSRKTFEIQLFYFSFILLFWVRPVENMVGLVAQVGAAETITAVRTIVKKRGVRALIAVKPKKELVALPAIHDFIAEFAVVSNVNILRILVEDRAVRIPDPFVSVRGGNQIALFVVRRNIAVAAVHHVRDREGNQRHLLQHLAELREKRF